MDIIIKCLDVSCKWIHFCNICGVHLFDKENLIVAKFTYYSIKVILRKNSMPIFYLIVNLNFYFNLRRIVPD